MDEIPEKYRHDRAIILETAEQIARDLNIENNFVITIEHMAFDELTDQLIPVIQKLNKNSHTFQSMLYKVDISEKEYRSALNENSRESFEKTIAELIIRRAFKKVLTRKYFSSK